MRAWLNSVRARPAGVWSNLRERSRLSAIVNCLYGGEQCERRVGRDRLGAAIEGDEPAGRGAVHIALNPTLTVGSDPVEIGGAAEERDGPRAELTSGTMGEHAIARIARLRPLVDKALMCIGFVMLPPFWEPKHPSKA